MDHVKIKIIQDDIELHQRAEGCVKENHLEKEEITKETLNK